MGRPWKYTRELLEPLVAESTSVTGVMRRLGMRPNGGAHTHLSRAIKNLGLDTSHFTGGPPSERRFRLTPDQILVRRPEGSVRAKPSLLLRALVEAGREYRCARCGNNGLWLGAPLGLDIDHIDGDCLNNVRQNLRFLCPNCHRQTPNFAGRNRKIRAT